jgi:septum formation inhibitor MinC
MSRRKKHSSIIVEKAQTRLAAVKAIDSNLDLGNGLTVQMFSSKLEEARDRMEKYNTVLSLVDEAYSAMFASEKALAECTENMLIGVAYKYGKNSDEYKMAGGTKKSDRKRPTRKTEATDPKPETPETQPLNEAIA